MEQFFLGVDGGGTSTRAVVVQIGSGMRILGRGQAASSNHYSAGLLEAVENIRLATEAATGQSQLQPNQIAGWGLGLAGACTAREQQMLHEKIAALTPGVPVLVDEDVAAAHAGAFAVFDDASNKIRILSGVICIAGTGANSFGIGDDGKRARADGLGHLLGDRGSGYRIGEAALRALCSAADGSGAPTQLQLRVLDFLRIASIDELVPLVYHPDFSKDRVAALFPVVLECAQNNDLVATNILRQAGSDLAATCNRVLRQCTTSRIALSGGVISHQNLVRIALETTLRQTYSSLDVINSAYEADIGAALLLYHAMFANRHL